MFAPERRSRPRWSKPCLGISTKHGQILRPASELAETSNRTFIAAIGTALLARATDLQVDPRALKVKGGAAGSYSARSLAKDVLAPEAMILGVDLGVYGREPLNNQPFFRYDFISPDMDVKPNARPALLAMCEVLERVAAAQSSADAEAGLRVVENSIERPGAALIASNRRVVSRRGPAQVKGDEPLKAKC